MTHKVDIVRAAHLIHYIRVLREAGVNVDRQLARAGLPSRAEEMPEEFVSLARVLDFVGRCAPDADAMEFGYRAAACTSLAMLPPRFLVALIDAPSGMRRLQTFLRLAPQENSAIGTAFDMAEGESRIVCDLGAYRDSPGVAAAEWLTINGTIEMVRSIAGPAWMPGEITFTTPHLPCEAAQNAFGNTRILTGQPMTSITIAASDLQAPCFRPEIGAANPEDVALPETDEEPAPLCLIEVLRRLIRPYLGDGGPDVDAASEIVGMRKRSLQRHLASRGLTYSALLGEARYDIARDLLADPSMKIIDVAMAAGYEHPQHFSRAFRHIAGVSPRAYRQGLEHAN